MKVPLFDPKPQNRLLTDDLHQAFSDVLESGYFILGSEVERFERNIAEWHGVNHAIGVSSGTDALLIALMALQVGPGDEVILPSFTFFATAGVVHRLGARPIFADVCPASYQILPSEVERCLSPRTKAVIPVHLFGHSANVEEIRKVIGDRETFIVEDVAQAMGASRSGKKVGSLGDLGCLSFFPTKNLGGFGDGGMVLTCSDDLAETVKQLRNHGMFPKYYHRQVGGNFRLDAMQAALLNAKLPQVDSYLEGRDRHAKRYLEKLVQHPSISVAVPVDSSNCQVKHNNKQISIWAPYVCPDQVPTWNQFTVRIVSFGRGEDRRDSLRQWLLEREIGSEIYYPVALHKQECFRAEGEGVVLPHTECLCEEVLSLPVYPELEDSQIDYVIEQIFAWLDKEV
ncbi:MAG: DegT/DnrJ/EryC1/StrS family aminotransferase [Verrucomicrobiota bacterium]